MLLGDYFHFLKTCTVKDKMILSQEAHPRCPPQLLRSFWNLEGHLSFSEKPEFLLKARSSKVLFEVED